MRRVLMATVLAVVLLPVMWWYIGTKRAYDPERVCAEQTDMSEEECLASVELARSAGW